MLKEVRKQQCEPTPIIEEFIVFAKERYGVDITVDTNKNPDTFEDIFKDLVR